MSSILRLRSCETRFKSSEMRMTGSVLIAVAASYALLCAALFVFQSRLVYFPYAELAATPKAAGLAYEDLTITTEDSQKLHGWFVPAERSSAVVLFLHGNAGNVSHRLDWIALFHEIGISTLIIDYRGYGKSSGTPSEEGTYRDAEAAWRYLVTQREIAPQEIAIFGESLGGAVAAKLAARETPQALIIVAAFTSLPDLASQLYSYVPARLLTRFKYDTREHVKRARCPVLVIHSASDEIVPFAHGRALYEAANVPKQFLEIRGGHNDGFIASRTILKSGIAAFLGTSH